MPTTTLLSAGVPVRLCGVDVLTDVHLDRLEHGRRTAAGTGGQKLGGLRLLDALLALPELVPVPLNRFDRDTLAKLQALPAAVQFRANDLVRVCRPAISVSLVTVAATSWRQGLRLAHRFAPFCSRRIVLDKTPRDRELVLLETSYWGIGVTLIQGDEERVWSEPAPFMPTRYTGAAWLFDEDVYAEVCSAARGGAVTEPVPDLATA